MPYTTECSIQGVPEQHRRISIGKNVHDKNSKKCLDKGNHYSPANGLTAVQNYVKTALKVLIIDALTQTQGYIVNSQLLTNIENAIREVE